MDNLKFNKSKISRDLIVLALCAGISTSPLAAKTVDKTQFYNYYSKAVANEKLGNNLEAVKLFRSAKMQSPKDYATLVKLGVLHLNSDADGDIRTESIKIAISYFEQAIALKSDDTLSNLMLAKAFEEIGQKEDAIKFYTKAANLEPDNILLRESLARLYFEQGNFKPAIEIFNKVILAYPDNLKARGYLGACLQATDNYLAAIEQYNYVVKYLPDSYSIVTNLGDSWLALKQYDKAREFYEKAKDLDPNVPNIYADIAFMAKQSGENEIAIENYKKALQLKDDENWRTALAYSLWEEGKSSEAIEAFENIEEHSIAGYIHQLNDDTEAAIASYKKAIELNPKDHKTRFNLAQIYQEKLDLENAKLEYEKLLEQKPNDVEVIFLLASLRQELGDIDVAVDFYEEILDEHLIQDEGEKLAETEKLLKNNVQYNLGIAYKSQQKLDKAEENFESLLKEENKVASFEKAKDVYKELSFIKIALGKDIEAEKLINGWLREDPTSIEARNLYADFLVHLSKERKAIEQLRLASALDKTTTTRLKLANLLHAQNNLFEALAEYQTVLQEDGGNLNALLGAANNFKALGYKDEAIAMYKQAIEEFPQDVLANYNYGLLLQEAKKNAEAKESYLKVLELNPNFVQAYYVLGLAHWDLGEKEDAKEIWQKFLTNSTNENLKQAIENILSSDKSST